MEPYANIVAANAAPSEQQPHPDPALLTTPSVLGGSPPDITKKVNVVQPEYGQLSTYTTSERPNLPTGSLSEDSARKHPEPPTPWRWEKVKEVILQPSIAGGLVGIVNIGLLAGGSYALYTHSRLRRDTKIIGSAMAATFALFGAEGYAIRACRSAPKENVKDQKKEESPAAALACRRVREHVPRPGIVGGTTGLVNAGILSIVGYLAYRNWDSSKWDGRAVAAASVGLLALWGSEMQYFRSKS